MQGGDGRQTQQLGINRRSLEHAWRLDSGHAGARFDHYKDIMGKMWGLQGGGGGQTQPEIAGLACNKRLEWNLATHV